MKTATLAFRMLAAASLTLALCATPLASTPASANMLVYRVTTGGATTGACGDLWSNPCNLQYALTSLASAGSNVWVAAGVYTPGAAEADSFIIPSDVKVYGGFDGVDDEWADRDPAANVTTLSGVLGSGNSSIHVVKMSGMVAAGTVLDGFTISGGNADSVDLGGQRGGGLYCDGSGYGNYCNPTLEHLVFESNMATFFGGAIYLDGSSEGTASPLIRFVSFINNAADWSDGGAIYCEGSLSGTSSPSISDTNFIGNTAGGRGGAIFNHAENGVASPQLGKVTFTSNSATGSGGAIFNQASGGGASSPALTGVNFVSNSAGGDGGAMYAIGSNSGTSSPSLTNISFNGNYAAGYGGAAAFVGSGGKSEPTLSEVTFSSNAAGGGGALYVYSTGDRNSNTDVKITNGKFLDNSATSSDGGAIYQHVIGPDGDAAGGSLSLVNAVFAGNTSENNGGAIYFEVEVDGTSADPVIWEDARGFLTLNGVSTHGNGAPHGQGGAIYAEAEAGTNSDVIIQNSILWGDTDGADSAEVHIIPGTGGHIEHSDLQGGCAPTGADCSSDHNLNADPLYAGPGSGMLWPQDASPVIDAGTNFGYPAGVTVDLAGEPRFVDYPGAANTGEGTPPIVDMGAYEVQFTCPVGPVVFVDQDATGSGSGNSWADAFTDLAPALQVAPGCPGAREFWVSEGVYLPGNYDASDTFHVDGGTKVYGGFDGTGDSLDDRDPLLNVTILSGDIDGDDDSSNADGNFIAEDAGEIVGENPYHIVTIDGGETVVNPTNTVLDGFTITGGYAEGIGSDAFGGGLYCFGASDAMCSPTLQNLVFSGNYAAEGGGGLANDGQGGSSSPVINNATFIGNWAGTLHTPLIGGGGAIINYGEANYEGIGSSNPTITNSTFIANKAKTYGGAIYNDGTHDGESSPVVANSTFVGNDSDHYGGAVINHAWDNGETQATYTNVTFSGNTATNGGGSLATDGFDGGYADVTVTNAIFWGGSATNGPEISTTFGTTTFSHSVIANAYDEYNEWDTLLGTDGGHNTEADPRLGALGDNGGPTQTMALLAGSSALDAGDDTACAAAPVNGLDQRGVIRPQGTQCDIGSYERIDAVPPADFDGLGDTDISVFRNGEWHIIGQDVTLWGQAGDVPVPADYDGDGDRDIAVWRPSTGVWYVKGLFNSTWGTAAGDVPVPGDYDGDGDADIAVWRPSTGIWYVKGLFNRTWGGSGDIPIPGDYDGDGATEVAVYRPSTGVWYVKGLFNSTWGTAAGDVPVPGDYDGDADTDVAIWRPSTGVWYVKGQFNWTWGTTAGDIPVPGDYDADDDTDVAVWRPSTGVWYVKDQSTTIWGSAGDFPVVAPDTNGDGDPYQ